jgi:hypothetical protein
VKLRMEADIYCQIMLVENSGMGSMSGQTQSDVYLRILQGPFEALLESRCNEVGEVLRSP